MCCRLWICPSRTRCRDNTSIPSTQKCLISTRSCTGRTVGSRDVTGCTVRITDYTLLKGWGWFVIAYWAVCVADVSEIVEACCAGSAIIDCSLTCGAGGITGCAYVGGSFRETTSWTWSWCNTRITRGYQERLGSSTGCTSWTISGWYLASCTFNITKSA